MSSIEAMRVVKCFSLELMATEMLHEARNWELQAQWYKRKAGSVSGADGEKRDGRVWRTWEI